jgi:class 3 adenylate cyclase
MAAKLVELKRLVGALEALALEEQVLLHQRQFAEVMALHEREMPLVTRISELLAHPSVRSQIDEGLRARVRAIINGMGEKSDFLDNAMADARIALAELNEANRRVRSVQPAYGRGSNSRFGSFAEEG